MNTKVADHESPMVKTIEIGRLQLSGVNDLLSFLRTAYPDNPRQSDPEFWKWHFLEAPHAAPDRIPVWVATSGTRIAGQLAVLPVALHVDGRRLDAACILDFIVAPEFRRQGLGKRLVRAVESECPLMFCIGTVEQHTPALLESLGWAIVGRIPRYHTLLFPGNDIREIANHRLLREAVNVCFAPLRARAGLTGRDPGDRLRRIGALDATFDAFWTDAGRQWPCAVRRDAASLRWQYERQPGKQFDVLGYFEGDTLLGYVVLFFRRRNAHGVVAKAAITDICYHPRTPDETVDALLRGAVRLAIERRAGGLVTDVTDPRIARRLRRLGFWRVKSPLLLMVKSPERQDLLYRSENWFLTRGDADISIFEHPNL